MLMELSVMQNEVASISAVQGWENHIEKGLPPPPNGSWSTNSVLDEIVKRQYSGR